MSLFRSLDNLGDVDAGNKQFEVFHDYSVNENIESANGWQKKLTLSRLVFAEKDRKFGEDTHVSPFQAQTSLQKADDLFKVTSSLIQLDKSRKLLLEIDHIEYNPNEQVKINLQRER